MSTYQSRMAVTFADGRRVVDWGVVWRIYFDLNRMENFCNPRYQSSKSIDGVVRTLDVDFEGAAADARMDADDAVRDLGLSVGGSDFSSTDLRNLMAAELGLLDAAQRRFHEQMQDNSRRNMKAMQANVGRWERAHTVAVATRDLAVIVLAAGGAAATGGTAAPAIAQGLGLMLGSDLLANIGKVQDKSKPMTLSEAVGEVTALTMVDFTFNLVTFGLGQTVKSGSKVVEQAIVIVVKTTGGTVNALLAAEPGLDGKPKSLGEATGGAYVDAVLEGGISAALESRLGKGASRHLRRTLLPGVSTLLKPAQPMARKALKNSAQAITEKAVNRATKAGAEAITDTLVGSLGDEKVRPLIRAPICTGAASHHARLAALFPRG